MTIRIYIIITVFLLIGNLINAYSDNGWDLLLANKYRDAISVFESEMSEKEMPEYLYGLAIAYLKYAQLNKTFYQQSLMLESNYYKANISLKGKEIKPSNYIQYYLGVNQVRMGEYEEAIKNLTLSIENPNVNQTFKGLAKIALAESIYRQGKYKEAKDILESLEPLIASDRVVGSELAVLYTNLGIKKAEMLKVCQNYQKLGAPPRQVGRFWHNIGWVFFRNNNIQDAIDAFSKDNLSKPDLIENIHQEKRIDFYVPINFKYRSIVFFTKSSEIFEKLNQQPEIRFKKKPFNSKIDYKNSIVCDLALAYLETDRPDNAIQVLKNAVYDNNIGILLGRAYYQKKQTPNAEIEWKKVRANTNNDYVALINLAYNYSLLGIKQNEIRQLLETTKKLNLSKTQVSLSAPISETYRRIGVAYLNIGKIDESIDFLEKGHNQIAKNIVGNPNNGNEPLLLLNLAFAFYIKGFNCFEQPTETFMVMQEFFYPEAKQLHNTMQGIFALWMYIDEEVKAKLTCEKPVLLFG